MTGGDAQVAPSGAPGPENVLGSLVAKVPSNKPPVAPNSPTATGVTVPRPMSMHTPVLV